jgi:hypothetical protein
MNGVQVFEGDGVDWVSAGAGWWSYMLRFSRAATDVSDIFMTEFPQLQVSPNVWIGLLTHEGAKRILVAHGYNEVSSVLALAEARRVEQGVYTITFSCFRVDISAESRSS